MKRFGKGAFHGFLAQYQSFCAFHAFFRFFEALFNAKLKGFIVPKTEHI